MAPANQYSTAMFPPSRRTAFVPSLTALAGGGLAVLGWWLLPPAILPGYGGVLAVMAGVWAGRWWPRPDAAGIATERPALTSGPGFATLSLVAEKTTSSVIITDGLGRIDWVNDAFTRMTGYTLADALGKRPGRLLQGAETQPAAVERFRAGLKARGSFEMEILNYRRDGRPYWVHMKIDPVFDPKGRLRHHIAIQTDITDRRREEITNAGVLAHASHCIVATDVHGLIEIFNPGAERLTSSRGSMSAVSW